MVLRSRPAPRPLLACEILPDRVLAARASAQRDFVEVHTARQLPAGAVNPSLTNPNISNPAAVSAVVADALAGLSGRSRDVIAVVPDAAVRTVLLEFDSLPQDAQETAGVIRFRLKKSLPFDVEKSVLSYHAQPAGTTMKVVVSVALASVVQEYEDVFVQAEYHPGLVLPSTLAALGTVDALRPTLVIKVGERGTTVAIVDQQELRLFRTLDIAPTDPSKLVDDVYPSLVFFEDQFGASVERILVGGASSARELAPVLSSHTAAAIEDLVASRHIGSSLSGDTQSGPLAAVVGALLG